MLKAASGLDHSAMSRAQAIDGPVQYPAARFTHYKVYGGGTLVRCPMFVLMTAIADSGRGLCSAFECHAISSLAGPARQQTAAALLSLLRPFDLQIPQARPRGTLSVLARHESLDVSASCRVPLALRGEPRGDDAVVPSISAGRGWTSSLSRA